MLVPWLAAVCLWAHRPFFSRYTSHIFLRASLQDGLILTVAAMSLPQPKVVICPLQAIAPSKTLHTSILSVC